MPVLFLGHGSPLMALEDTDNTRLMTQIGKEIIEKYGKPKAILAISAHWYTRGSFVTAQENPEQIYDMYGFPDELYALKYPAKGDPELAAEVEKLTGHKVKAVSDWGIDHGVWSLLVHLFPDADIPVVAMSVDGTICPEEMYELGKEISALRDQGVLIAASGNIVHNLRMLDYSMKGASEQAEQFDTAVLNALATRDDEKIIHYGMLPFAGYAVPTPEHFLPLIYAMGASENEVPKVFNRTGDRGALTMTSLLFGFDE